MNELKIFENPAFGKVRVVEQGGEPWFVGKDVAEILGYSDLNKAVAMHVDDDDKKLNDKTSPSFGQRGTTLITALKRINYYTAHIRAIKRELDHRTKMVYTGYYEEALPIYRCEKCGGTFENFGQSYCCWCGRKIVGV